MHSNSICPKNYHDNGIWFSSPSIKYTGRDTFSSGTAKPPFRHAQLQSHPRACCLRWLFLQRLHSLCSVLAPWYSTDFGTGEPALHSLQPCELLHTAGGASSALLPDEPSAIQVTARTLSSHRPQIFLPSRKIHLPSSKAS